MFSKNLWCIPAPALCAGTSRARAFSGCESKPETFADLSPALAFPCEFIKTSSE